MKNRCGIRWYCPDCDAGALTYDDKIPMHRCKGMRLIMIPLILVGTRAKHEPVERGDYVGAEVVQTDAEGRVVQSVVTTRDDGQDCTIFAPVAGAGVETGRK